MRRVFRHLPAEPRCKVWVQKGAIGQRGYRADVDCRRGAPQITWSEPIINVT
jgi:hypothetical protein